MGSVICIMDRDIKRVERIKYIIKVVLAAQEITAEFIENPDRHIMEEYLRNSNCIFIYNECNDCIEASELVDYLIINSYKATFVAMADTSYKLFRFLPANPFLLMNSVVNEQEFMEKISLAIKNAFI